MGLIRKTMSVSGLGIVDYRSARDQKAYAATVDAKAAGRASKAARKAAEAEARLLDA